MKPQYVSLRTSRQEIVGTLFNFNRQVREGEKKTLRRQNKPLQCHVTIELN